MSNSPAESASTLLAERAWLQGAILCAGAYGIVFTLSLSCLHQLWSYRGGRVQRAILILYVGVVFLLCTLFVTSNTAFTQMAFINDRNFPGGPAAYEADEFSIPVDNISNVAYVIANWCTDAVLVWRTLIICQGWLHLPRWLLIAVPCVMYSGSFAMSIPFLIQVSTPASSVFTNAGINSVNWTAPYMFFSLANNIVLTLAIVVRLLCHRRSVVKALGTVYGKHYISMATVLVESSAVYSAFSLLFLVPFAMGSSIANVFVQPLCQFQAIGPLLIIYRVSQGKAWTTITVSSMADERSLPSNSTKGVPIRFHATPISSGNTTKVSNGANKGWKDGVELRSYEDVSVRAY